MRINNNVSAVITNKQLLGTENSLAASMERLSSGLRINHAQDDPSGIAISAKMQAQINALNQASRNASDGTSVLQTVDGALSEVTDMIQRIRELSVQAANGINAYDEKVSIQEEVNSLLEEIDRISQTTEFNTKSLLDGSLDARVYANNVSRTKTNEFVSEGIYKFTVDQAATRANYNSGVIIDDSFEISENEAGKMKINGSIVELTEGMSGSELYEAIRKASEIGECSITNQQEGLSFTSVAYGADAEVHIEFDNPNLAAKFLMAENDTMVGTNMSVTLDKANSEFGQQATVSYEGNKITISDVNGFEMSMLVEENYRGDVSLEVTDVGIMTLQIGANQGQGVDVRVPASDCKNLYIDDIDVTTVYGAKRALGKLDKALAQINATRSQVGAYENRLEYAVNNLDLTEENMTAAISRIEDVDMAEEMVEYTKNNVLVQAGTSALAQANELPQMALQLLQK